MDESSLTAQVKSAAWGLASIVGVNRAVEILRKVIGELERSQWEGPGNR